MEIQQTKKLTIQTKNSSKFIYPCTAVFVLKLYSEVFCITRGNDDDDDENMKVEN